MSPRNQLSFRNVVRDLLYERDWTQKQLARTADVDPGYLCRVLRADTPVPAAFAARVADALHLAKDHFPECRERAVIEAVRNDPDLRERLYEQLVVRAAA